MNSFKKRILAFVLASILMISAFMPRVFTLSVDAASKSNIESLIDDIFNYQVKLYNSGNLQSLLNGEYAKKCGVSSDWFVFSLIQYKGSNFDFSAYADALSSYASSYNEYDNAVSRERMALVLSCFGDKNKDFITRVLNNDIGELGIMSYIYGLHILNNGYSSTKFTSSQIIDYLLEERNNDGGWAINSEYSDVDVTAMTLQCLAPYYSSNSKVKEATDNALSFLSSSQLDNGGFKSYGTENSESAAQVVVALTSLNINPLKDSRFIKNGKTAADAMLSYEITTGAYSHKAGGDYNGTATSQVLYALISLYRYNNGFGGLYKINNIISLSGNAVTSKSATTISASTNKISEKTTSAVASKTAKPTESKTEKNTSESDKSTTTEVVIESVTENDTETVSLLEENQETTAQSKENNDNNKKFDSSNDLKIYFIIGIWVLAIGVAIIFIAKKNKKVINYVIIVLVAVAATVAVIFSNIQTKEEFFTVTEPENANVITVTMSITCDSVAGKATEEITPSDGIILPETTVTLSEGSTVYDCFIYEVKQHEIQFEDNTQAMNDHTNAYIAGINNLYEFDYGELSGWMYSVNGEFADVGCGQYTLSDGDNIEWQYTCNLGEDLK
jgi:prenyltransferase beta subunit